MFSWEVNQTFQSKLILNYSEQLFSELFWKAKYVIWILRISKYSHSKIYRANPLKTFSRWKNVILNNLLLYLVYTHFTLKN